MNLIDDVKILGGLSHQEFLNEYWQQKPLLIRQAFDGSPLDLSPEELAGLACDTEAPSRIVIENGDEPWESLFGPFDDNVFAELPDTHWTLLVNDLERYLPELRDIIEPFRFIPDWRIDDLMLSYAVTGGSVGPHTDEYDVFLIQTSGTRHWKLDTDCNYSKEILSDCSLSILKNFNTSEEWVLQPGDMLYLPPNLPHFGIAKDDACMTLSVGFRAPSQQELINGWVESTTDCNDFKQRYSDKCRLIQKNSAEITKNDIAELSRMILEGLNSQEGNLPIFLGKYLTETKGESALNEESLEGSEEGADYIRQSWLRLAYIEDNHTLHFFADGEHFELSDNEKIAMLYLCDQYAYSKSLIEKYSSQPSFKIIFERLLEGGGIYQA